jgi:hypothetical protein
MPRPRSQSLRSARIFDVTDEPQSALRRLLGNRLVQILAVIVALLAIYIEGIAAIKGTYEALTARAQSKAATGRVIDMDELSRCLRAGRDAIACRREQGD